MKYLCTLNTYIFLSGKAQGDIFKAYAYKTNKNDLTIKNTNFLIFLLLQLKPTTIYCITPAFYLSHRQMGNKRLHFMLRTKDNADTHLIR